MRHTRRHHEAGIALVLALLSLMLLTFLGLTLATSTSTELQIANNYRWSQQAFYNAEAGLEVGKKVLATADWNTILYTPRTTPWDPSQAPTKAVDNTTSPPNRNYENWSCDYRANGAGYGVVLNDGSTNYLDRTTAYNQPINGAFTLWVRRPVVGWRDPVTGSADGRWVDSGDPGTLILTAEGVAPYSDVSATGTVVGAQNRAVRTMEMVVSRALTNQFCGTLAGQVGGGPEGAGFGGCSPVDTASIQRALGLPTTTPMVENAGAR